MASKQMDLKENEQVVAVSTRDLCSRLVGDSGIESRGSIPRDGKFLFSCYVGSRMYNLHNAESDEDFFMVWAASTDSLLKIQSPWPKNFSFTFKNPEDQRPDYTIHEVKKFFEMIIAGEPRCIDCIFVEHPQVVGLITPEFQQLRDLRHLFVTKNLMVKYIGMIRQDLSKLTETRNFVVSKNHKTINLEKVAKRLYVVSRNLYSCESLLEKQVPLSWLSEDSPIHSELLNL
jgi:predicted nucleotidyltransferase